MKNNTEIILYKTPDGKTKLEVRLREETIWLSQNQMAILFKRSKQNISLHINNCFKEKELDKNAVVKESLTTASDGKKYLTKYYNLDVIISVGYRVKSRRGTEFRIWATNTLKEYLLRGYILNEKRLKEQSKNILELRKTIDVIARTVKAKEISTDESKSLINIIRDYANALELLDEYDNQNIKIKKLNKKSFYFLTYEDVKSIIADMHRDSVKSSLFGKERNHQLKGIIQNIYVTFAGKELYPSVHEKAAHLLYFIVKDHPFVDGNKRIAASVFLWYLYKNRLLYKGGAKLMEDDTLAALTLMLASSNPKEKDIMIKVIIKLLSK